MIINGRRKEGERIKRKGEKRERNEGRARQRRGMKEDMKRKEVGKKV